MPQPQHHHPGTPRRAFPNIILNGPAKYGNKCRLGTVEFHMNPQSYKRHTEVVHITQPTLGGFCRFDYPPRPAIYTLQGTTGTAGVYGQGGSLKDLERYLVRQGQHNYAIPFSCPSQFKRAVMVYLNYFDTSQTVDNHLLTFYDIELEEAPSKTAISVVKLKTATNSIVLPAYGGREKAF